MKIGTLNIPDGASLAPMAGVTDACFRPFCFEFGTAFAVSEMLSAKGYLHISRNQRKVDELLWRAPGDGILGLQLFGHQPELVAEAANQLTDAGFQFIDINIGCPMHKIVSNGDGAALLKSPDQIGQIVSMTTKATKLPVTVKIRSGWDRDSINAPLVAKIAQDNGAKAVAVHARTRDQFYSGNADWGVIEEVKRVVDIPVIGNGDVRSGPDAVKMMRETGCDMVMVGRAAQGNPWIFRDILCELTGKPFVKPTMKMRVEMALRHMEEMEKLRGERGTLLEMRKHVAWYLSGERGCAKLRNQINQMKQLTDVRRALDDYLNNTSEDNA